MVIRRWLRNILLGLSLGVMAALFILWGRSGHSEDKFSIPGPGSASFQFDSYQGRVMFGVFESDSSSMPWWRPWRASMNDLLATGDWATADMHGWGIAVPHLLLIILAGVWPAWWWLVFRKRGEQEHRSTMGLCSECGYDLRESPDRCPECGRPAGMLQPRERENQANASMEKPC